MISTNIGMTEHDNRLWLQLVELFFSHDAFVSQKTFANKLCSGILAAKSQMNLDMRWDYLDATVRTTDNLERLGWGQSQNPQLAIVSSSLNWINVFDPFCFCRALLQLFPLCYKPLKLYKDLHSTPLIRIIWINLSKRAYLNRIT